MRRPLCFICIAFVAAVFIALQLFPLSLEAPANEDSWVTYVGRVYQKEYKNGQLVLYLEQVNQVEDISKLISNEKSKIKILCYTQVDNEPRIGSTVCIEGKVQSFSHATNPGGFDAESYYQVLGLSYRLVNASVLKESEDYSFYHEFLYQLRRRLEAVYDRLMPEKYASIMKAIVLGNKTQLDAESKQLYQRSGISHILAISGLHISLIGMGLYKLLRRLNVPLVLRVLAAIGLMLAYGDMVGMSSSAYRAIFMFAMRLIAEVLRRTYDMLTALAVAAVTLVVEQPLYLENAGFLLSFGAILGLGCVLEAIKITTNVKRDKTKSKYVYYMQRVWCGICNSMFGSISIFLIQFPMMLCFFYEFPIYSFLLNLIIIPLMGVLMGMGLLCLFAGGVMNGVGGVLLSKLMAVGCQIFLDGMEGLCGIAAHLPLASWIVGKPSVWQILVFYGVVLLLLIVYQCCKRSEGRVRFAGFTKLLWIIAAVFFISQNPPFELQIVMLDVGQGDGIWLETDTGHHYLIDGGSTSESELGKYTLIPFLKYMGTDRLEAVFLTHLDEDHTSGVYELIESGEAIEIGCIVIAKAAIHDEAYEELVELCDTHGIELVHMAAGDVLMDGAMRLEVLHPTEDYVTASRNAYSLVMSLEYGEFRALFTGDVEADGEELLVQALVDDKGYDLYKVAHHGSRNSNSMKLLECIRPRLSVISCAEDNSYGHPHAETLERLEAVGSEVMATKDYGAIMISVDEEVSVRGWRTME
ncbi:MAG: DNA internalization-related competence protein ComEC/Rec2 [Lachnospiraceae bacterium]|nr:DNA internalization-related competence protein ComEC/Rec2 [Lachnospiraceae bacterium]